MVAWRAGILVCTLWLALAAGAFAQLPNTIFSDYKPIIAADSQSLSLQVYGLTYLRNNEYFVPPASGYTLFGHQVSPRLRWQPAPNFVAEGGIFLNRSFGDNFIFNQVIPIFNLQYRYDSLQVVFGTLAGALSHNLIEPLFAFERLLTNRQEQGVQFLWKRGPVQADLWMDWQRYQFAGAPFRERFFFGTSNRLSLISKDRFKLWVPLQATIAHAGGQRGVDSLITTEVANTIHTASGLGLDWGNEPTLRVEYYYTTYSYSGQNPPGGQYSSGNGHYPGVSVRWPRLTLMAQYWQGNGWVNPVGAELFSNVALPYSPDATWAVDRRQVLFLRALYYLPIFTGSTLAFRVEPHYDITQQRFDYNFGFYLQLDQGIRLGSVALPQ